MEKIQINKSLRVPQPPSETVIAQSRFFLFNNSKNEHFNGKNISPTEILELHNNFQSVPLTCPENVMTQSPFFCTKIAKIIGNNIRSTDLLDL